MQIASKIIGIWVLGILFGASAGLATTYASLPVLVTVLLPSPAIVGIAIPAAITILLILEVKTRDERHPPDCQSVDQTAQPDSERLVEPDTDEAASNGKRDPALIVFDFAGRTNRSVYWIGLALVQIPDFLIYGAIELLGEQDFMDIFIFWIPPKLYLLFLLFIRRLHDVGFPAWVSLCTLFPSIGFFVVLYIAIMPGVSGPNQYGPKPSQSGAARTGTLS